MALKELSLEARMVYAVLWTRSNGDNVSWPGQKSIGDTLGVGERSVRRYLKELEKMNLIEVERKGLKMTNRYLLIGQLGLSRADSPVLSRADTAVLSSVKEQKEKNSSNTDSDGQAIAEVLHAFEKVNPAIKRMYGNTTQRKSADSLISQFGLPEVLKAAQFAVSILGVKYAPKITTPYELETSWAKLVAFAKEHQPGNHVML